MARVVPGVGPKDAKIVIVGEAPGAEEERQGIPFCGAAGRVLDSLLRNAGIDRNSCYITNVVKERPHNNDFSIYYTDSVRRNPTDELIDARIAVREEVRQIGPNMVVALGNEALKALTGMSGVMDFRGSVLATSIDSHIYKTIPVIHPAMILRAWEYYAITQVDFNKIARESQFPQIKQKVRKHVVPKSLEEVMRYVDYLKKAEYLCFDVETTGNHLDCIGFAICESFAVVIPITEKGRPIWTEADEVQVWKAIRDLLQGPQKKIAQNAAFDMTIVYNDVGIEVQNLWMDTMNAFHILYSELLKSLAFQCSIYTDVPYYKDQISYNRWQYNALDAMVTYEVAMCIEKELMEEGLHDFYHTYINELVVPYMKMSRIGLRVDLEAREQEAESMEYTVAEMEKALNDAVGHEINVVSSTQMKSLIYGEFGIPPKYNRSTGSETTDAKALELLSRQYPSLFFDFVLSIRTKRKLLSQYMRMPVDPDGKVRTTINIAGTETGRVSSSETIYGTGGNLQNFPKGSCRRTIIPSEGMKFLQADLSQAEARLVAAFAQEHGMQSIFDSGKDFYKVYASLRYKVPYDAVTKEQRTMAKRLVHATNYRMGARTFANHVGISEAEARFELEEYFRHFPNIRIWFAAVEDELRRNRCHVNPFGRKRRFYGRWDEHLKAEAVNDFPQGTVGDIIHHAFLDLYHGLPKRYADIPEEERPRIVLQVHDSLLLEYPTKYNIEESLIEFVRECMLVPVVIHNKTFVIPVDISVGNNWDEVS